MDISNYVKDSCVQKFIKSANQIHTLDSSINIDYGKYIAEYNKASKTLLPLVAKLKLKDFIFLCTKFPNFDFTFEGRLKSEYSYFNKIIKSYVENSSVPIEHRKNNPDSFFYDIFAFRIVLNSISYNIDDSFSTIDKKGKVHYKFTTFKCDEKEAYKINEGDTIRFADGTKIVITKDNLVEMNSKIYVISENGSYLPINRAQIVKEDRSALTEALYNIQDALDQFYQENNFEELEGRNKDYVKNPKMQELKFIKTISNPNSSVSTYPISNLKDKITNTSPNITIAKLKRYGLESTNDITSTKGGFIPCYQSLHKGYCYKPYNVYFENQIRTIHMHNIAEYSSTFGHDVYKSNRIDENSLSKLPAFITYSKKTVRGKPEYSYTIQNMEYSVKKSFGISLEEFYDQFNKLRNKPEEISEEPEL